MNFIDSINKKYSKYITSKCEKEGCCIGFRGMSRHICLKGEKLSKSPICDCLLFYANNDLTTAAIELKSGSFELNKVIEQLSNGSQNILMVLRDCRISASEVEFYPILMHKKGPNNSSEKKKLSRTKIVFNRIKYSLLLHKCGTEFLEIRRLANN